MLLLSQIDVILVFLIRIYYFLYVLKRVILIFQIENLFQFSEFLMVIFDIVLLIIFSLEYRILLFPDWLGWIFIGSCFEPSFFWHWYQWSYFLDIFHLIYK